MPRDDDDTAHLTARPRPGDKPAPPNGTSPLGIGKPRDGLIHAPPASTSGVPVPLFVLLHGAGGEARGILSMFQVRTEKFGLLALVPESRGPTWDIIRGGYGPDVAFLNEALEQVFAEYDIDSHRIAIGGFSDGASYALSLGLGNGDLFTHILAFSPGFVAPPAQRGAPRIFISHGTRDRVLPIKVCSRAIAPMLEEAGYTVLYREFEGEHTVPSDMMEEAFRLLLDEP